MKFKIYPYKQGSRSAKTLAEALEGRVLKLQGSKFKPNARSVVINWGSGAVPNFGPARVLNKDVNDASCKLRTLKKLKAADVRVPEFWEKRPDDFDFDGKNNLVVCRTKLRGHSGDGIVLAENKDQLVNAPLYTKYVPKKDEYRVHVFGDKAFFIQRKARKLEVENPNWRIRNLDGGFVFSEVAQADVPVDVIDNAIRSISALNLDFGGVDVIWNDKEQKAYVLEINTACGLEERTAENYKNAVLAFIEG